MHDAPLMGKQLATLNFNPDLILCSTAKRTKSTFELISQQIPSLVDKTKYEPSIYEASMNYLIQIINALPNHYNEVAIIGHNPGITMLSNYLTDEFIGNVPTCGMIKIEIETNGWNEIIKGIGHQKYFIYPKMYY